MNRERASLERLRSFFTDMTRRSFGQLGVGDREVTDYIANLLAEFAQTNRWLPFRNIAARRCTSVVEMLAGRLSSQGERRLLDERALRKHVGDYTLFMSGLFRAFVERCGYLDYYLEEGSRSYQAVSALDAALYRPGGVLFEELARGFERYSGGLDYMRKCFFAPAAGEDPFAGFFRQIEGWIRYGFSDN